MPFEKILEYALYFGHAKVPFLLTSGNEIDIIFDFYTAKFPGSFFRKIKLDEPVRIVCKEAVKRITTIENGRINN